MKIKGLDFRREELQLEKIAITGLLADQPALYTDKTASILTKSLHQHANFSYKSLGISQFDLKNIDRT